MVNNYTDLSAIGKVDAGGKKYVTVYNDTGSTISNGAIKLLVPKWIAGKGVVMVAVALATNTTETNTVGICDNNPASGIAAGDYGNFLVEGLYGSKADGYGVTTSGSVAANDQLEILNAATALIDAGADGGAALLPEAVAIAVEEVTTNVWAVYLIGKQSQIKAS